jgi:hypothetical protein
MTFDSPGGSGVALFPMNVAWSVSASKSAGPRHRSAPSCGSTFASKTP